jgi:hypothetical protein
MKKFLILFLISAAGIFAQESGEGVFSYLFEEGKKYHIFQYRANLRDAPGRNGGVLAVLSMHDEIEILENSWKQEKINDVYGYWYKIKYGNITGYTFGGNIAVETLIADIDKNGIPDYFSYRLHYSYEGSLYGGVNNLQDIKIVINNREITTREIIPQGRDYWDTDKTLRYKEGYSFNMCEIIPRGNYVTMEMLINQKCWMDRYIYKVFPAGNIRFIEMVYDDEYVSDKY